MTGPHSPGGTAPRGPHEVLSLSGVRHSFGSQQVLAPLDLTLQAGTTLIVGGPNGAGKSTLLRVVAGLLAPSAGTRYCATSSILLAPGSGFRAREFVLPALRTWTALAGRPLTTAEAEQALSRVGLPARSHHSRVQELSAGQRARLTLALAATIDIGLICLDEPGAHLDDEGLTTARAVVEELRSDGRTVVMATHDPGLLTMAADAQIELRGGSVVEVGS